MTCGPQRWEDFTHATDELVAVLEGDMEFEVEGQGHHPQALQFLFHQLYPAPVRCNQPAAFKQRLPCKTETAADPRRLDILRIEQQDSGP